MEREAVPVVKLSEEARGMVEEAEAYFSGRGPVLFTADGERTVTKLEVLLDLAAKVEGAAMRRDAALAEAARFVLMRHDHAHDIDGSDCWICAKLRGPLKAIRESAGEGEGERG